MNTIAANIVPIVVVAAFATTLLFMATAGKKSDAANPAGLDSAWAAAAAHESSPVARMLLSVARPIAQLPAVQLKTESALYKALRLKVASSSGLYGGSVEVFLSVQIAAILLGSLGLIAVMALHLSGLMLAGTAVFSLALAAMPYNRLAAESKKRLEAVTAGLPEFAELLLMPVTSGYGILPALDFTASRLEGPVAAEVRMMLQVIDARAATEQRAFLDTGERLGTPAAVTFFNTLYQSYVDGIKVADNIRGQAAQLRQQAFERTRARLKALPNKLVIIMGLHLIPFLFSVVLLPTFIALGSM